MEITVTVTTPEGRVLGQTLTIEKADLPHYREAQFQGLFDSVIEHRLPARRPAPRQWEAWTEEEGRKYNSPVVGQPRGTLNQYGTREIKVERGCILR